MKQFKKRWSNLTWYEKVAATPGLIIFGCLCVVASPIFIIVYCGVSAAIALGYDDIDESGSP